MRPTVIAVFPVGNLLKTLPIGWLENYVTIFVEGNFS
jgi:hypothetical protein